jgi:hypothetical protein
VLAERFVRSEISVFPGWNAPDLDVESDEIDPTLASLCRAGFLTCASQPSRADQRAFVAGFAHETTARKLLLVSRELDVRLFGLREETSSAEPISRASGRFHAFAGHDARTEELACFEGEVGAAALAELECAIYVSAFDPVWGRSDLLWNELSRALEFE